jgi:hypothetical protein
MGNLLVKAELFMTAYHHNRYTVLPIDCETNEIVSEILKWYFLVGFCSVIICYIPVLVFVVFVATMAPVGPTEQPEERGHSLTLPHCLKQLHFRMEVLSRGAFLAINTVRTRKQKH